MRLKLGPIVGHTDERSTRIWIRTPDDPKRYMLRIRGKGLYPFHATSVEFGTAIAMPADLRPDRVYRYQVLRRGRVVTGAGGTFRTMPQSRSMADMQFVAVSCNDQQELGVWQQLADFIDDAKPHFLLMLGDQVYLDQVPNAFGEHLDSEPAKRRAAMAEKYQESWSREPIRTILANIPSYCMWDDHDIRDGWGSFAPDSPTLAQRYRRGQRIFERFNAYFEDARDVYFHFQQCRNPPASTNVLTDPPPAEAHELPDMPAAAGERRAMPIVFRCGRVVVLMLDSRGARDLWREQDPALGIEQWRFVQEVLESLAQSDDVLVVVTTVPIASMSPTGAIQWYLGGRADDVEMFKKGDTEGLLALMGVGEEEMSFSEKMGAAPLHPLGPMVAAGAGGLVSAGLRELGIKTNFGGLKLADIDDVRDQWSHERSRDEQERLIRKVGEATRINRLAENPRAVVFLGGDLHSGGQFEIRLAEPEITMRCLITSGVSRSNAGGVYKPTIGTLVDEAFEVAPGIHAELKQLIDEYNFGTVHIIPTAGQPSVTAELGHEFWKPGTGATKLRILGVGRP